MNKIARTLLTAAVLLMGAKASAHGIPQPQHGGLIDDAGLVAVEMVSKGDTVELYLTDDDQPVSASNVKGVLTVTSGDDRKQLDIVPVAGNQLESNGITVTPGARVSALLTLADGQTKVNARFKIPQ